MVNIFKNLFSCNSNQVEKDIQKEIDNLRNELQIIKRDIKILYNFKNESHHDLQRLEDKLDHKFDLLTSKVDNLILILNNKLSKG